MQKNAVYFWDFTCWVDKGWTVEKVMGHCKEIAKQWVFQLERAPTTGKLHYQGRVNLKVKVRNLFWEDGHASVTSTEGSKSFNYVMKEETRVDGPWKDKDTPMFKQSRIDGITLRPWQKRIENETGIQKDRVVDIIFDPEGGIGKSTLVAFLCYYKKWRRIPMLSGMGAKDLMQLVMCMPKCGAYCVDMPRALNQAKQIEFFEAIEMIKDGYAFDTRYEFNDEWFECPRIFLFMNIIPDLSLLSRDRWRIWKIVDEELVKYIMR